MNLKVNIGQTTFQNPITVASGTFWYHPDHYSLEDVKKIGAIIPKTVTMNEQEGNPPPRICETPSGMLNAIGIDNDGVDVFIAKKLPALQSIGVPLIISVSATTPEDFVALAKKVDTLESVVGVELNLSCPNLKKKNLVAQDAQATEDVIKNVKKEISERLLLVAKLTPNVTNIVEIASAAKDAGADALALINTLSGMVIDTETHKPYLGNGSGGLSGPAIRPVAVKMVYDVAAAVDIPIIGMGGIMTAQDALEFLMAGATMVAVGTANFIDPQAPFKVLEGIQEYMTANGIGDINQLIGCAHQEDTKTQGHRDTKKK